MSNNNELENIKEQIQELSDRLDLFAERQNAQFTEMMFLLNDISANVLEKRNESQMSDDELYEEAEIAVIQAKKASASFLQRKFKIGYARAANLMDLLEKNGVIGTAEGSYPRKVLG